MEVEPGRLLVVDDDELNRDMLSRRLERKGYSVAVSEDGPGALALVDERPFDLVLLDVMMPGISGLEVLKILRTRHAATELPVIMATARDQGEDIVQALLSVTLSRMLSPPPDPSSVLVRGGDDHDPAGTPWLPVPPAEVADELGRRFPFDQATSQYFTIIYGLLDVTTGAFEYVSAGHP